MSFQVISDIHLDIIDNTNMNNIVKCIDDNNMLILAGDIGNVSSDKNKIKLLNFIKYCSLNWKYVIYILGNHEFYDINNTINDIIILYKDIFKVYKNVYILNDEYIDINGIRYIGSTLWSKPCETTIKHIKCIRRIKDITLEKLIKINTKSINYIINKTNDSKIPIIIITHFPIINDYRMIDKKYKDNIINDYFMNDYINLIKNNKNIEMCINGHTHTCCNFYKSDILFVSYPYMNIYYKHMNIKSKNFIHI